MNQFARLKIDSALVLLPVALALWFVPFPLAPIASRTLLLLSVCGGIARIGHLDTLEVRWISLMGLFLATCATSALFSNNPSSSLLDLGRQIYVVVFSILLVLAARGTNARATLARAMIIPPSLGMTAVAYFYLRYGSGFTNEAFRQFKGSVSASAPSFAMNPIAAFIVLTLALSAPLISRSKYLSWAVAALFALVMMMTGARTTLIAIPAALLLFGTVRFFSKRTALLRLIAVALPLAVCFAMLVNIRTPSITVDELDTITTHRVYLWQAALRQFANHPWLGEGADTWRVDFETAVLPVQVRQTSRWLSERSSGAYHNAYLTFLAERGVVVFVPAMLILLFVLRCAFRVFEHRRSFVRDDRAFATLAPVMVLFILIRQLAECSGLLGYADGAGDFAGFALASVIVALAVEVDHPVLVVHEPQRIATSTLATVSWQ